MLEGIGDLQTAGGVYSKNANDVVADIYRALLCREADSDGVFHYSSKILAESNIEGVISSILRSDEFRKNIPNILPRLAHPDLSRNEQTFVFLHAQKTGGTSLKNMIREKFDDHHVYDEYEDTLYLRSPAELAQYQVFMGHFNYDSIKYIDRDTIKLFTFMREPRARIVSLYKFWAAHDSKHPSYHEGMELARRFEFRDFLVESMRTPALDRWNHMTWVVLGNREWERLRSKFLAEGRFEKSTLDEFREVVQARLKRFEFIGMQHDFSNSSRILQNIFGRGELNLRHDHSIEKLSKEDPLFKGDVVAAHYFDEIENDAIWSDVIGLDVIVFEEALRIYNECVGAYSAK